MSRLCHADDHCNNNTVYTSVAQFFSRVSKMTNGSYNIQDRLQWKFAVRNGTAQKEISNTDLF